MDEPDISVVIPVYCEEESLPALFGELWPALCGMGRTFEVIFVNDGSRDGSLALLSKFRAEHPREVTIVDLACNCGQHMAVMAGFEQARGRGVITLDADLQNPPSEIPRVASELAAGHDVVGTYREHRHDPLFRKLASRAVNRITNRIARLDIRDYGCMLRGYDRRIVDIINDAREAATFIPALARKYASNPIEIPVAHRERERGKSKYGLWQLIRLNFDLMTGFSTAPLQAVTSIGMAVSALSFVLVCYMTVRRLVIGPEVDGVFTLMAIQFFLTGLCLLSLGLCGEYVGRIHREVSRRPRYTVRQILCGNGGPAAGNSQNSEAETGSKDAKNPAL